MNLSGYITVYWRNISAEPENGNRKHGDCHETNRSFCPGAGLLAGATALAEENRSAVWGWELDFGIHKLLGGNHDYSNVDQFGGLHFRYGLSSHWSFERAW